MNQLMMSEKPGWQDSRDTSETGSGVSESFLAETERAREATKELEMKRQELFDLQKQHEVFFGVLRNTEASESAQKAAFMECDEIQREITAVQARITSLSDTIDRLGLGRVMIPEDEYMNDASAQQRIASRSRSETGPFRFNKPPGKLR